MSWARAVQSAGVGPADRAPMPIGARGRATAASATAGTASAAAPPAATPRNARRFTDTADEVLVTSIRTPGQVIRLPGNPVRVRRKSSVRRGFRAQIRAFLGMSGQARAPVVAAAAMRTRGLGRHIWEGSDVIGVKPRSRGGPEAGQGAGKLHREKLQKSWRGRNCLSRSTV